MEDGHKQRDTEPNAKQAKLADAIRGRQWKFIRHVLREEDGIERHVIETPMEGKRARGRQRIAFLDWTRKRANARGGTELGEMARNRGG